MSSPNTRVWIPGLQERLIEVVDGRRTYMSVGPKGEWQFRHEFDDVQPEVDASRELAKNDDHWKKGVKQGMLHYAHVPANVLFLWHCEGVDIRNPRELIRTVNKPQWSYLKCCTKVHVPKN